MPRRSKKENLRRARLWQRCRYVKPFVCEKAGHGKLKPIPAPCGDGVNFVCRIQGCTTDEHLPSFATPLRVDIRGHGKRLRLLHATEEKRQLVRRQIRKEERRRKSKRDLLCIRRLNNALQRLARKNDRLWNKIAAVHRVFPPKHELERILKRIRRSLETHTSPIPIS